MAPAQRMPSELSKYVGQIQVAFNNSSLTVERLVEDHSLPSETFYEAVFYLYSTFELKPHQIVILMGYYNEIMEAYEEDEEGYRGLSGIINDFMEGRNFMGQLEDKKNPIIHPQPVFDVGNSVWVMAHNRPRQGKINKVTVERVQRDVGSTQTPQSNPPRTITVQETVYRVSLFIPEYADLKLGSGYIHGEYKTDFVFPTRDSLLESL